MKALKTIVATAVIVFALTTVAMAGVRHVGSWDDTTAPATGPAATATHQGGMTLTDAQFARLLRAVSGQAAKQHTPRADRTTTRERARAHIRQTSGDSADHVQAQQRTQIHKASGGTHDGGGTHNGGTHVEATHAGGTHDGGANHE